MGTLVGVLAQPLDVVPIPGTTRVKYVQENVEAANVAISIDEIAYLSEIFARDRIIGEQYAAVHARTVER
jgi:aryl-alcohol dehydrogenase-like predicted oxidoreductase